MKNIDLKVEKNELAESKRFWEQRDKADRNYDLAAKVFFSWTIIYPLYLTVSPPLLSKRILDSIDHAMQAIEELEIKQKKAEYLSDSFSNARTFILSAASALFAIKRSNWIFDDVKEKKAFIKLLEVIISIQGKIDSALLKTYGSEKRATFISGIMTLGFLNKYRNVTALSNPIRQNIASFLDAKYIQNPPLKPQVVWTQKMDLGK